MTNGLIAKRFAEAIQDHGADAGFDYAIGDIEAVVYAALSVMGDAEKGAFLAHESVREVFESAGHERSLNEMRGATTVVLTREQIRNCPSLIMLPSRYHADGVCKCVRP